MGNVKEENRKRFSKINYNNRLGLYMNLNCFLRLRSIYSPKLFFCVRFIYRPVFSFAWTIYGPKLFYGLGLYITLNCFFTVGLYIDLFFSFAWTIYSPNLFYGLGLYITLNYFFALVYI